MYERPTGARETSSTDSRQNKWLPPGYDPLALAGSYFVPNTFTRWQRIFNSFLAAALLVYGTLGIVMDDMFIPGRWSKGLHLHGLAAWLMYGAILTGASVLFALVVDHYDRRNNEQHYIRFKRIASHLGWCLFGAALVWHFWSVVYI